MGKILGLGGIFIKANDPKSLADWYERYLGIPFDGNSYVNLPFADPGGILTKGYNVFSFFPKQATYYAPSEKEAMINLRVDDLPGLMEELKNKGVEFIGEPIDEEYGKFAWIMDPEGNKIELWEPPVE